MLQRKHTPQQHKQTTPLWTQEESIAFECAKEAMNDIAGICSSLIAKEKAKPTPDLKRIEELYHKRLSLLEERDAIHFYDKDKIAKVRRDYGEKIKAYREGGECPV